MDKRIGLEMEMVVVNRRDGRSHPVTTYFDTMTRLKQARGLTPLPHRLNGRVSAILTPEGESGLDNGFNLLETAFAPIAAGPGGLDRLATLVTQELHEVTQALAEEGAALLNASEHPDCSLSTEWYEAVRVERPIYRELVDYRGWLHCTGIDAKAQNSPCTGVPVAQAARALNAMLALSPTFIALFANSPLESGVATGLKENRLSLWDRMFRGGRFPGDHFLQCLPPRPFEDLGDHYRWMYGPDTVSRALARDPSQDYKSNQPVYLDGNPSLGEFLRSSGWTGRSDTTGESVRVLPQGAHFVYAQYAHFLDARWRYQVARQPSLDALLAAWDRPGGIEEVLIDCGADGYIEGRAPGAVFADIQLVEEAGEAIAATAPISPSALQLGLLCNLDEAERLWRKWGWQHLRSMRADAIRHAMDDDDVHALALETLAVARDGLSARERHWLDYAQYTTHTRRTGADRLLSLWQAHSGSATRLANVCTQRVIMPLMVPSQV